MQEELLSSDPGLQIQFFAINEIGFESRNDAAASGKDLPLLQDVDDDGDGQSDVWTSWDINYRDVVVVDANGEVFDTFNLTINNLANEDTYDELKEIVLEAAAEIPDPIVDPVAEPIPGDLDGNGDVSFADFLVLSNNFGKEVENYSDGDIDGDGSVGFADFLVLSNNFGKKLEAAASSDASSTDAVFAVFVDADNEDE